MNIIDRKIKTRKLKKEFLKEMKGMRERDVAQMINVIQDTIIELEERIDELEKNIRNLLRR